MDRTCDMHSKKRNLYKIVVGKLEGRKLFGRPRIRCEDNIKIDVNEI
jgi:hypothetical protein